MNMQIYTQGVLPHAFPVHLQHQVLWHTLPSAHTVTRPPDVPAQPAVLVNYTHIAAAPVNKAAVASTGQSPGRQAGFFCQLREFLASQKSFSGFLHNLFFLHCYSLLLPISCFGDVKARGITADCHQSREM